MLPRASDRQDPRNRLLGMLALIAACLAVPLVIAVQQFMQAIDEPASTRVPDAVATRESAEDPGVSRLAIVSKLRVKMANAPGQDERGRRADAPDPHRFPLDDQDSAGLTLMQPVDEAARSRVDRFRAAIVAGELHGSLEALRRLKALAAEADQGGDLHSDARWLIAFHEKTEKARETDIPAEAWAALVDRHGWFGRLARVYGKPLSDPDRQRVVGGFEHIVTLREGVTFFQGTMLVVSILVGLGAAVRIKEFTGAFDAPAVGGSVYLEMFAIGMLVFVVATLTRIPFRGAGVTGATAGLVITELLVWCTGAAILWPMARGVRSHALRVDLGLHRGEGVLKELGWGVVGWIVDGAAIFLFFLLWSLGEGLLGIETAGGEASPEGFPLFEHPLGDSWALVWVGAVGAVLWAPFTEELLFRGALYRYLHPSCRWLGAAVISAAIFGFIHPYDVRGCGQVAVGGFVYAILREWRGSLIAPITAHLLHNGVLTLVSIWFLTSLG